MFSLKYKNLIKSVLVEEDYSTDVALNNIDVLTQFFNNLKKNNVDDKIYIRKTTKSYIFYTLTEDKNFNPSDLNKAYTFISEISKENDNKSKSKLYRAKRIELETISEIYNYKILTDKPIIIAWDENENVTDIMKIPEVSKFFNGGVHNFEEISNLLNDAYEKNRRLLSASFNKKEDNIQKPLDVNSNEEEARDNPPEKLDKVDKISNEKDEQAFVHDDKWIKSKQFLFDPQHIIGDNKFRTMNGVYLKVSKNLQKFYNDESSLKTAYWVYKNKTKDEETGKIKITTTPMIDKDTIPPQFFAACCLEDIVKNASELKDPFINLNIEEEKYKPKSSIEHINGMKMPETLTFNENTPGYAKELVKLLDVKPAEIISPLVVLGLDDKIFPNDNSVTKNTLINVFGGNINNFHEGLVSYPNASEELIDSYCAIKNDDKYSLLGVSTKGGYDGKGAQASTVSLFRMIYKDPSLIPGRITKTFEDNIGFKDGKSEKMEFKYTNENNLLNAVYNLLNSFGKKLFDKGINKSEAKDCQVTLAMLTLFGGHTVKNHQDIINNLKKYNIFGVDNSITTINEFCNYINTKYKITDCIMNILDSQKYKFAQLNCTPRLDKNVFGFDYKIQYPAHFEGTVDFEPRGKGVGFHILGKIV